MIPQRSPAEELQRLAAECGFTLHKVSGADDRFWLSQRGHLVFGGSVEMCETWLGGVVARSHV
jgi:hypothetical protein